MALKKRGEIRNLILFFLGIAFFSSFASASTSDKLHLNIQAVDGSGNVVNGTFKFEFNITTDSLCNNVIWTNYSTLTTDSRGIVSYYLEPINFSLANSYYLCEYRNGVLQGSGAIASAPYAFYANDSQWIMGTYNSTNGSQLEANSGMLHIKESWFATAWNNLFRNPFNQDLNTTANVTFHNITTTDLQVTGTSYLGNIVINADNINGTNLTINNIVSKSGNITLYNSTKNEIARFLDNGNVGIGTLSPATRLQVGGTTTQNTLRIQGGTAANLAPVISINRFGIRESFIAQGTGANAPLLIGNTAGLADYNDATLLSSSNLAIDSSGKVGIGTSSPDSLLSINAATTVSQPVLNISDTSGGYGWLFVNGGNPTTRILLRGFDYSGNETIRLDPASNSFISGGGVTIGSPTAPLATLFVNRTYSTNTLVLSAPFVARSDIAMNPYITGVSNSGYEIVNLSSATQFFVITSGGKVGIGTNAPTGKLQINDTSGYYQFGLGTGYLNNLTRFTFNPSGVSASEIYFRPADTTNKTARIFTLGATGGGIIMSHDATSNDFFVDGDNGNIGIGTNNPTKNLEIIGSSPIFKIDQSTTANGLEIMWDNAAGLAVFNTTGTTGWGTSFQQNGTERMRIASGGNIGIGTTSPTRKLQIDGASPSILLNSSDKVDGKGWLFGTSIFQSGDLVFHDGTSYVLVLKNGTGNVGIGTSTPSNTLDVRGTINASGMIYFNNGTAIGSGVNYWGSNGSNIYNTTALVGIGTATPNEPLQIHSTTGGSSQIRMTDVTTGTTATDGLLFSVDSSSNGYIWNYEGSALLFGTNNIERMRIQSSGDIVMVNSLNISNNLSIGSRSTGSGLLDVRNPGIQFLVSPMGLSLSNTIDTTLNIGNVSGEPGHMRVRTDVAGRWMSFADGDGSSDVLTIKNGYVNISKMDFGFVNVSNTCSGQDRCNVSCPTNKVYFDGGCKGNAATDTPYWWDKLNDTMFECRYPPASTGGVWMRCSNQYTIKSG